MSLKRIENSWEQFASTDPLWAIITRANKDRNRWDLNEFFELGRQEIQHVVTDAKKYGIEIKMGSALDFGCGVGRLTQALCEHFEKVVGVDIARTMISLANKYNRFGTSCSYVHNEANDLRCLDSDQFEFIYSNIVLQHIPPKLSRKYITEFVRVLKPGGVLLFQLPSMRLPGPIAFRHKHLYSFLKILRLLPLARRMYQLVTTGSLYERMEMHSIPRAKVVDLISSQGAIVLQIDPDFNAPGFEGFRYWVTK